VLCNFVVGIGVSQSVMLWKLLKPVIMMLLAHYINFPVNIISTVMACIVFVDRICYLTSHIYDGCSVTCLDVAPPFITTTYVNIEQ
jgi:hypothetical protein